MESKAFPGSFVRRIEFDGHEVGIEYTMPNKPEKVPLGTGGVPNTGSVGCPRRPVFLPDSAHTVSGNPAAQELDGT